MKWTPDSRSQNHRNPLQRSLRNAGKRRQCSSPFQAVGSCIAVICFLLLVTSSNGQLQSIVGTKHNLSTTGPGSVRSLNEDRICVFCHAPHGGRDTAPLWNRNDSQAMYIPYDSPTLKANPGQPTGSSKLCLSCHDGTIALGDVISERSVIDMAGNNFMPSGKGLIGTDLRNDHPISFPYDESLSGRPGELTPSATWDTRVQLDPQGMLQCTTCHDAHSDEWGHFLVMENLESSLCRQCHQPDSFEESPHALSTATWNGSGENPWSHTDYTTVRSNACLNCHQTHHSGGAEELLTHDREEDVCLVCHDGSVASGDLASVFQKPYRHPVERNQGTHQPGESPNSPPQHVECVDCHNPHQAREEAAEAPFVMGVLKGVSGVDASGFPVDEAMYEYEVCFKCHADDGAKPFRYIERQIPSTNLMNEFSPSSPSFHPVEVAAPNGTVPSLMATQNGASLLYCSDCHGNSDTQGLPGNLDGPHGSDYPFLLVRDYRTDDMQTESFEAYALCYECHSQDSILADASFPRHNFHVVEKKAPCSVCHDPHGIDFTRGSPINNAHLINFDVSIVQPDESTGLLEYRSLGFQTGECYLSCHGVNHSPKVYPIPEN